MRSIEKTELNELLVDQAILRSVQYAKERRTATLTFTLDDGSKSPPTVILHCESVFQVCLSAYGAKDFSALGIRAAPSPDDIDQVVRAFVDQYIFEWTMDFDELVQPPKLSRRSTGVFLVNDVRPPPPYRGIGVFKDTEKIHFRLLIVGTALLIEK
jgi:hypothetical protein